MTAKRFDVFLSHNSRDKPAMFAIGEALKARGVDVWLDAWELVPGRPWQEALEEIITTVRTAAICVGPSGLGPWEEPEMRSCLSQFVERRLPVIPVILEAATRTPELPLFLGNFTWVDLRQGDGLDRLVWGITGHKAARAARHAVGRACHWSKIIGPTSVLSLRWVLGCCGRGLR